MSEDGSFDTKMFGDRFEWRFDHEPFIIFFTKVEKKHTQLFDSHIGQIVGEKISFQSTGGWIENFSPAPGRGGHCDSGLVLEKFGHNVFSSKAKLERRNFILHIFKQTNYE